MLFNSIEFLFFFPIVTVIYFFLPHRFRWFHLLVSSCIFYMAFIPVYIFILLFTIVVDYVAGIYIEKSAGVKRKFLLVLSIVVNVGFLAFFKYFNFFTNNIDALLGMLHLHAHHLPMLNIILPIGLSFHTFQAMSYTIEVYRGHQRAEKHFGIYALYVMFYPQLVAGPIERPQNMLHQFHARHEASYDNFSHGFKLILWGMFKKVVIADRLAILTDPVFNHPHNYPAITLLIGAFFFSFQIFCDFSGYSDIALGCAEVMGFRLMQNFKRPYHAQSISEFWQRWHISLSSWFRDYLYIPLGGNRVSVPRWYFNLLFVFIVSGLWHGANWTFIAWGLLHGVYLVFAIVIGPAKMAVSRKVPINLPPALATFYQVLVTFILVMTGWIFFRANNITDALYIISRMPEAAKDILHSIKAHTIWLGKIDKFMSPAELAGSFILIIFLESVHLLQTRTSISGLLKKQPVVIRWLIYYVLIFVIIWFGCFENRQFIYFQF